MGQFKDFIACNPFAEAKNYEADAKPRGITVPEGGKVTVILLAKDHTYKLGAFNASPEAPLVGTYKRAVIYTLIKQSSGAYLLTNTEGRVLQQPE